MSQDEGGITTVDVHVKAIEKSQFELDVPVYYEIWQPNNLKVVKIQKLGSKWVLSTPNEQWQARRHDVPLLFEPPTKAKPTGVFNVHWMDCPESIQFDYDSDAQPTSVMFIVATYCKAPDTDLLADASKANWDMFIRRSSTLAVFYGDSGVFSRPSRAYSEIRFTKHSSADHEIFTIQKSGVTKHDATLWELQLRKHWETNYFKKLWDGFLWKEFQFLYTETVVPINIVVDGPPVRMSPIPETTHSDPRAKDFYMYNGVSAQSHYNLPENYQCSEEWLEDRLSEITKSRGYNLQWFVDVSRAVFDHGEKLVTEFRLLRAFAVRVCTIHCETIPYLFDICFSLNKQIINYDIAVNAAAFFGDCEDVARTIYRIAVTILKGSWTSPVIRELQRVIAFIGVPVGVGGRGQAPVVRRKKNKNKKVTSKDKLVAHQFAALIPVTVLHKALFGKDASTEKVLSQWAKAFRLDPEGHFWTTYAPHPAIMEGTMVTTPFYSETNDEITAKDVLFEKFRNTLNVEGEDECVWKKCALEYPLSVNKDSGCTVHAKVQRLYIGMLADVYADSPIVQVDSVPSGKVEIDLRCHHSFMVYDTFRQSNGINGPFFFNKMEDPSLMQWKLQVTAPMTDEMYQIEKHIRDQFDRPVQCLLAREHEMAGQCVLKSDALNTASHEVMTKQMVRCVIPRDRTRRLMVVAWVLDHKTMQILDKLLSIANRYMTETDNKKVERCIVPYDNCYAVIYRW
jgi:hypothetical protein